jgi:hypothetical protein
MRLLRVFGPKFGVRGPEREQHHAAAPSDVSQLRCLYFAASMLRPQPPKSPACRAPGPGPCSPFRRADSEAGNENSRLGVRVRVLRLSRARAVHSHWQVPRRPNREPDRGTGIRRLGVWAAIATGVLGNWCQCHRAPVSPCQ